MTETLSKTKKDSMTITGVSNDKQIQVQTMKNVKVFRPNIRVASAIVGAIAFLQKSGFKASTRAIKTCIVKRQRSSCKKSLTEVSKYLNRGVELGIFKKWNGGYKLGQIKLKNRKPRRKPKSYGKNLEVIKAVKVKSRSAGQSTKSSVSAF